SQPGDYAGISQSPNTLGSIRTGPDMSNEGGTHPDGWHRSHYWNARSTTPMSVMPRFSFLSADETDALISYTQSQGGKLAALRYAATQTGNYLMRLNAGKAGLDDPGVPVADLVAQLRGTGELRENGTPKDKAPSGMSWMDVWHMNSFSRS
ncbi:MAG: cbb3-type cytochrome c oxidase subunit II, partial [Paracoccus sp. (in: a-proteobacteria)]